MKTLRNTDKMTLYDQFLLDQPEARRISLEAEVERKKAERELEEARKENDKTLLRRT